MARNHRPALTFVWIGVDGPATVPVGHRYQSWQTAKLSMARVLILGGSGLLGRALQRRQRSGDELSVTHHSNPIEGSCPFDIRGTMEVPSQGFDVVICSLP